MPTYTPEYAMFSCNACQASTAPPRALILRSTDLQAPPTPRMTRIPLPPESIFPPGAAAERLQRTAIYTYPLSIIPHITLEQQSKLRAVELSTPVHVHSPLAHIGTITAVFPDQMITALDVVLLLRSIVIAPLDFHTAFAQLSPDMKERVRKEFLQRTGTNELSVCESIWARFISEDLERDGPLGIDLLFGNSEVWGLEACSMGGYSIVHVANVERM